MQQLRLECRLALWRTGSLITQAAQVSGHDKSGEIGIQIRHRSTRQQIISLGVIFIFSTLPAIHKVILISRVFFSQRYRQGMSVFSRVYVLGYLVR